MQADLQSGEIQRIILIRGWKSNDEMAVCAKVEGGAISLYQRCAWENLTGLEGRYLYARAVRG